MTTVDPRGLPLLTPPRDPLTERWITMRVPPRRIRTNLEQDERSYGVAVQLPSPEIVEIAGYTGYDFAWIDAEHGSLDYSEIRELIRAADAAGVDSLVRVQTHDPSPIAQVLDLGATAPPRRSPRRRGSPREVHAAHVRAAAPSDT